MRSFPSAFATAKNLKLGSSPVWILKLTVNSVNYYLSDHTFTVPSWDGGITTLAWVSRWGSVLEQVSGVLSEIRIADLQLDCLIDTDASPNMETLATATDLEKSPAILYLWFAGLDASVAPPQEMFRGYVREVVLPDEITVQLTIEDATVRLHNLVGTLISTASYPNADPDDIGRILPLPYGVVKNCQSRSTVAGLLTTLKADITSGATSCAVARPDGIVPNTTKFKIGSEVVLVTAVTGDTLTITRAQDGTTAAAQSAGDRLLEYMSSPFVFVVGGYALTSIDKVLVRAGDVDVDVTDQCTRYTGQTGSQYGSYGAKGVITITQAQADVIRDRVLKAGALTLTDPNHTHQAGVIVSKIGLENMILVSGTWLTSDPETKVFDGSFATGALSGAASNISVKCTRDTAIGMSGTPKRIRICGNAFNNGYGDMGLELYFKGSSKVSVLCPSDGVSRYSSWWSIPVADQTWTNFQGSVNTYVRLYNNASPQINPAEVWMEVEYDPSPPSAGTGITGSINSVADVLLGGPVFADVTAALTDPDDVVADLLSTWCGVSSLTLDGSFPAGYAFNGVIVDQEEVLPLLHRLAFQCRSWFRMVNGSARLVVRPDTMTSEKTISACRVNDGRRVHSRRKADAEDIVNRINLRYNRDWTQAESDEAYLGLSSTSDATSITDYGERERPDLFRCPMITSATMADSVRDFYLADLKRRKWLHEFEVYLDHAELEFGDVVTLGFAGSTVVELLQAGPAPGDTQTMDVIRMVGRG